MLEILIITLFLLWILGLIRVDGLVLPDAYLFSLNNVDISLWNIITLLILTWIIGILPSPFSEIAAVMLILWILAVLGIFTFAGLPNIFMFVILIGLVLYMLQGRERRY